LKETQHYFISNNNDSNNSARLKNLSLYVSSVSEYSSSYIHIYYKDQARRNNIKLTHHVTQE